ncbi:hypothetical protein I3842_Q125300 [Carya illinoinensis]|uniref:Uncharacterized protein n=1 Tax=Carya illinoinensis TaxID=32201 RepID=A0A922A093_CARIL|nr:hypothetical protein I3842_Q125300 [Carya illinoinensis]
MPLKRGVIRIEDGETSQGGDKRVIPIDQEAQTQGGSSREERSKMLRRRMESEYPKHQKYRRLYSCSEITKNSSSTMSQEWYHWVLSIMEMKVPACRDVQA